MKKICAIMAIYNEEDIINESINCLIDNGIDVYIIDNGSTDNSSTIAKSFLDRGVIGYENLIFKEHDQDVYNWTKILKRKEEISKLLNYDWFIHVDADEIRLSPWPNLTLQEAISFVDALGYNLINFKLFNFRFHQKINQNEPCHDSMTHYSNSEKFNSMQVKAWKKCDSINLITHGGHLAIIQNSKIFPQRFILKHYPIRSQEQAIKKINKERKSRFRLEDKSKGWHVQYDTVPENETDLLNHVTQSIDDLQFFDSQAELGKIQQEALIVSEVKNNSNQIMFSIKNADFWKIYIRAALNIEVENVSDIINFYKSWSSTVRSTGTVDEISNEIPGDLKFLIEKIITIEAIEEYLNGNPHLFDILSFDLMLRSIQCQQWK